MKLDEFAKKTGLNKRTIHFYIDEGLIIPSRSENNYYDFSAEDVDAIKKIMILRKTGMPIESIKDLKKYPGWLNYFLNKSIKQLKSEITEKQSQIENALTLLDTIAPHSTPDDINIKLISKMSDIPEKESVSEIYDTNDDFMVATFLLVQYVRSDKNFYKRYIWNEIAKEMRLYLGDMMDYIRNVIYTRDVELMQYETALSSELRHDAMIKDKQDDCVNHLYNAVMSLYLDNDARNRWTEFYTGFTKPLLKFYSEKANEMISAYNPQYTDFTKGIAEIIKNTDRRIRENENFEQISNSLKGIFSFDCENVYCDYFMIYTFFDSFYSKQTIRVKHNI